MTGLLDKIIGVESGGNPYAKNPRSSAYGPGQFINSTWLDLIKRVRPDLSGLPPQELLAMRSDPQLSRTMTQAYADENAQKLRGAGFPVTPGNTYLSHFAGPAGAQAVLGANPNAPVASILGPQVMKANPFLAGMTAADLQAWADRKMGARQPGSGPSTQPGSPQARIDQAFGALQPPQPPPMMAQPQMPPTPQGPPQSGPSDSGMPWDFAGARTQSGSPLSHITPDSNYWALFGPGMTGVPFFGLS